LTVVFLLYFVCQQQKVYFKKQKENILYLYFNFVVVESLTVFKSAQRQAANR